MAKHIVEYLYYFKKSNDSDVKTIFLENLKEFEYGSQLKYNDINGNLLYFNYNIIKYDTSLHVTFTYDTKKMTLAEVRTFQNLLREINIKASKSRISSSTLFDSNSLFFYKRLLPLLHKYEWSLRKLIYLLAPTYFSKDWVKSTISVEAISQIRKKIKGNFDSNNLLQMMDLYDFEEYLFGENYIKVIGEEEDVIRYKEFGTENLITTLVNGEFSISKPYSLWEEIFNQYIDIDLSEIQNDMRLIRDGRNIVGHNKEISSEDYENLSKGLKKYIKKLDLAFNKILDGNVDRNLIKESKDIFNDYMSEYFKSSDHLFNLSKSVIDTKMFESINKLPSALSKPAIDPKMFESINKFPSALGKSGIDPKMFESINKLRSTLSKPAIDPKMFESINKLRSTLSKPAIDPKMFESINKLPSELSKPAIDPKMFESINNGISTPSTATPSSSSNNSSGYIIPSTHYGTNPGTYVAATCTFYVKSVMGSRVGDYWGNAEDWAASASADGFTVDNNPVAGSTIAVFGPNVRGGSYGHVAVVESVNKAAGTMVIGEAIDLGNGYFNTTSTVKISDANYGFIHV
ncbi:CHAP domain-containing protein [Lactococcus lactis subsp. lactis]|uniref:CHAP domain-containing protein n=2 Tax=Bacillota TaxID=1239 RepID=UPI002940FB0C|nr:CHAP domain-containing protein [Lactococcus lactis]MDV4190877.1 CHAP domain-containing protein [Lactococcus lactis subsp. lactis]